MQCKEKMDNNWVPRGKNGVKSKKLVPWDIRKKYNKNKIGCFKMIPNIYDY